jgi:predicted DNA-binding transcriptional regulator AlpA
MSDIDDGAAASETTAKGAATATPKKRGNKKGAPRPRVARPFPGIADDDVLLTAQEVGAYFGGPARPFDIATIYRGAAKGIYPLPVQIGPKAVRWLRSECRTAREKMIAARGKAQQPQPTTSREV